MKYKYRNPRLKPIYPLYRLTNTTFRIGAQLGITTEFEDPEGKLFELCNILDGRDIDDVIGCMRNTFQDLRAEDVLDGLNILDSEALIEESWDLSNSVLDQRYEANVHYFSRFTSYSHNPVEFQNKIRNSSILLLGLGGGGSNILTLLAGIGPKLVKIVDYDKIEKSNLGRQLLYRESDLGKLKVEVAAAALSEMNTTIDVRAYNRKIVSEYDILDLLKDIDLVICAIDEPPFLAQRIVNKAIVKAGVPCVFGASQVSRGRVFSVIPGETGCFDCLNIHYTLHDEKFIEQFVGFRNIEFNPPTMAYAPAIFQLTSAIVDEVVRILTGYAPPRSLSTQYEINYEDGSSFTHPSWKRYEKECPTCGNGKYEDWEIFKYYNER